MENTSVRVRFAPSPTGPMHLGNVRVALMNAIFAKQQDALFILRIEDTDPIRSVPGCNKKIIDDLDWLKIKYDEGPYFQSERQAIYKKYLNKLIERGVVYRAFETAEELKAKKDEQIAKGFPPRYDRGALALSKEEIEENLEEEKPFIWRLNLPGGIIEINDLGRGKIEFDMKNFSDFALTRRDGTFTFLFANFVDDLTMGITHIFRGEDHLTNSANQVVLYQLFSESTPIFYHLPLICNIDGKKLSKRDFGFSLDELKNGGFLREAIINYLAILGSSFKKEIMDFAELVKTVKFDRSSPTGQIKYDIEKLRWINRKWIKKLSTEELTKRSLKFLEESYSKVKELDQSKLKILISTVQEEVTTLRDFAGILDFYFKKPEFSDTLLEKYNAKNHKEFFHKIVEKNFEKIFTKDFSEFLKKECKRKEKSIKEIFALVRIVLTGKAHGIGINSLISILPKKEIIQRLKRLT